MKEHFVLQEIDFSLISWVYKLCALSPTSDLSRPPLKFCTFQFFFFFIAQLTRCFLSSRDWFLRISWLTVLGKLFLRKNKNVSRSSFFPVYLGQHSNFRFFRGLSKMLWKFTSWKKLLSACSFAKNKCSVWLGEIKAALNASTLRGDRLLIHFCLMDCLP